MKNETSEVIPMTKQSVCIIVFAKDGTPHKVVKDRKTAIAYCGDNTYFNWGCYSIED